MLHLEMLDEWLSSEQVLGNWVRHWIEIHQVGTTIHRVPCEQLGAGFTE